jgi:hypothetical protein
MRMEAISRNSLNCTHSPTVKSRIFQQAKMQSITPSETSTSPCWSTNNRKNLSNINLFSSHHRSTVTCINNNAKTIVISTHHTKSMMTSRQQLYWTLPLKTNLNRHQSIAGESVIEWRLNNFPKAKYWQAMSQRIKNRCHQNWRRTSFICKE